MKLVRELERMAIKKHTGNQEISKEESDRRRDKILAMMGNKIKVKK
jgi:hypothetical protein